MGIWMMMLSAVQCYPLISSFDKLCYSNTHHVIIRCYQLMLSPHVITRCYRRMLSPDVIAWGYHLMLAPDVITWCYHLMLSPDVITPMLSSLSFDVIICPMLSADVIYVILPSFSRVSCVIAPCYHLMLGVWLPNVIISYCHPMLSSHKMLSSHVITSRYHPNVMTKCYHLMLSSNVIIQCYHTGDNNFYFYYSWKLDSLHWT
jgi:hypothetical protein